MPIFVKTSGPAGDAALPQMRKILTYADMVRLISDELDDMNDAYLPQIQNAVLAAVRFCAREPFYFNRNREAVFAAKPGYACYGRQDSPALALMGGVRAAFCEANGQQFALRFEEAEALQSMAGGNAMTGLPCLYGFFGNQLCLYPIPDKAYRIKLLLNPAYLPDIESPEAENPWFTEAFALVKARAKYDLYKDILKDAPLAAAAFNDFREEWAALQAETSRRATAARRAIQATQF